MPSARVLVLRCPVSLLFLLTAAFAAEEPIPLEKFVVTPGRYFATSDPVAAPLTLSAQTLQALPQVGDDLYRTLAHFPGLATNDFSARFWVRGAPHEQILTRLDGLDLIEPFHLRDFDGSLSIIDPASIDRLTLHTGGFTAEFGDHLAAVIEFETDEHAPPRRPRTGLNASVTGLRAAHERPFSQARAETFGSLRVGTPQTTLALLGYEEIEASYYDLRARVSFQLTPAHRLSFNFLHAADDISFVDPGDPRLTSTYQSNNLWARLRSQPTPSLQAETVLSFSTFDTDRQGNGQLSADTRLQLRDQRSFTRLQLRQDWSFAVHENLLLRSGFDLSRSRATYDYDRFRQRAILLNGQPAIEDETVAYDLRPDTYDYRFHVSPRLRPAPNLVIEPGLRYDENTRTRSAKWSPRFNASVAFGANTFRAGWGVYRQNQALHQLDVPDGDFAPRPDERTTQGTLGFERPLGPLHLRVEAYQRLSSQPPPRYENVSVGYDTFLEARSDRLRLAPDEARARGVEFVLSKRTPIYDVSASYTLSRVEERLPAQGWIPRARDQRHALGLNFVYTPNARWRFAASWHFHTGWATTEPSYRLVTLPDGRTVIAASFNPLFAQRLPAYHRLDFRIDRRWRWADGKTLSLYLDLFNAYDRTNLIGYERSVALENGAIVERVTRDEQFPLLPNLGLTFEF